MSVLMRVLFLLLLLAGPASAWEFSAQPVCRIWHTTEQAEMEVRHDPGRPAPYSITVELFGATWPRELFYAIHFDGPFGFTISTDRHQLLHGDTVVLAEDAGFENVLRGLESNLTATPYLGSKETAIPLKDAPLAVAKFRDCTVAGLS